MPKIKALLWLPRLIIKEPQRRAGSGRGSDWSPPPSPLLISHTTKHKTFLSGHTRLGVVVCCGGGWGAGWLEEYVVFLPPASTHTHTPIGIDVLVVHQGISTWTMHHGTRCRGLLPSSLVVVHGREPLLQVTGPLLPGCRILHRERRHVARTLTSFKTCHLVQDLGCLREGSDVVGGFWCDVVVCCLGG